MGDNERGYVGPASNAILGHLLRYWLLTATQITKLQARSLASALNVSSLRRAQRLLRELTDGGYVVRKRVPSHRLTGTTPLYYGLTDKGLRQLRALGLTDAT